MQQNLFNCETIVFGKGTGESILVKLSPLEWMLVDSCYNENRKPAALEYLKSININAADALKLIIISHFHDDHIKGLSHIIEVCTDAKVVISSALNTQEFSDYIEAISENNEEMSKTSEFKKILTHLPNLKKENRLILGKRDCVLYRSSLGLEVHALSPCDNDIVESNTNFVNELKLKSNMAEVAFSAKKVNPNNYCIVTKINHPTNAESHDILLGGDLEVKRGYGWDAVCDAVNTPKPNKVGLFKIPHHGSQNGYHQRTWDELIRLKPLSLLTTYDSSPLPQLEMINLYKNLSSSVYCTANPKGSVIKDESKVQLAKEVLSKMDKKISFRGKPSRFGMIHVTESMSAAPNVRTEGEATAL